MSQSAHGKSDERVFRPMGIAILTVSDSRTLTEDRSGRLLQEGFEAAGHAVEHREVVPDEVAEIQRATRAQLARQEVHTVVVTGGTDGDLCSNGRSGGG